MSEEGSMNSMNNWWTELEILKKTVAEQQEQIQKAYIRIKELNEQITKESVERKLLGLNMPQLDNASMYDEITLLEDWIKADAKYYDIPEDKPVDSTPYSHNRQYD